MPQRYDPHSDQWIYIGPEPEPEQPQDVASAARPPADPPSQAALDVLAERERQKAVEGWTTHHDDTHDEGELASAAAAYIRWGAGSRVHHGTPPADWPWDAHWWKPKDRRRDLVRAGALILAEIERLDRLSATSPTGGKDV